MKNGIINHNQFRMRRVCLNGPKYITSSIQFRHKLFCMTYIHCNVNYYSTKFSTRNVGYQFIVITNLQIISCVILGYQVKQVSFIDV